MKSLSPAPAPFPLSLELGAKRWPESDWLYSTGGRPHDAATDPLAQGAIRAWRPDALDVSPQALKPGWAGMASYRVPFADGDRHLKVAMAPKEGQAAAYRALCEEAVGEAGRAAWAGSRGLGPQVQFVVPQLGAFFSTFAPGTTPTLAETQGPLLSANVAFLARLHQQDASEVPGGGHVNWLLEHVRADACMDTHEAPRPAALQHALLQVEAGLQHYLSRATYTPVPIHDDYKPDNTLASAGKLTVVDWNNLRVADAAIDLGHFATMADVPAAQLATSVVAPYLAEQKRTGAKDLFDANVLTLTTGAYTALFRLRNAVFYDQWDGSRPKADYVRHQLIDDVASLRRDLFDPLGLRPALGKDRT